jgi:hypothetical protein
VDWLLLVPLWAMAVEAESALLPIAVVFWNWLLWRVFELVS